jgi:hypothetical protein
MGGGNVEVISAELGLRAKLFKACRDVTGVNISQLSQGDLRWVEDVGLLLPDEKKLLEAPLWAISGSSSGSGYGYGDGSGYGSGYGYGLEL